MDHSHTDQYLPDPGHADHSIHGGALQYFYVFLALCALSTASFITTSKYWPFQDPHVAWAFMMAVSCCKALLVVLFFMHVKWEASWKYVLTIPAAFMSLFLILMLIPDVGMRGRYASEERQLYMPQAKELSGSHHSSSGDAHMNDKAPSH